MSQKHPRAFRALTTTLCVEKLLWCWWHWWTVTGWGLSPCKQAPFNGNWINWLGVLAARPGLTHRSSAGGELCWGLPGEWETAFIWWGSTVVRSGGRMEAGEEQPPLCPSAAALPLPVGAGHSAAISSLAVLLDDHLSLPLLSSA